MLDQITTAFLTVRNGGLVDNSARPDAPVIVPTERRPRAARTRLFVAARLHQVAAALEPAPRRERSTARSIGAAVCR